MSGSAAAKPDPTGESGRMTFVQHLEELRVRLIHAAVALVVTTIACFSFAPELFDWLRGPLENIPNQQMVVLSPLEMFITYLKLAVLAGVFVAAPYILWQVWLFVSWSWAPSSLPGEAPLLSMWSCLWALTTSWRWFRRPCKQLTRWRPTLGS
jgi:hypothetical protein